MDIPVQVANTTHEAWRCKNVKRKTDRDDALKGAQLSAMNQLPTVQLPCSRVRQWRSLIGYRWMLVTRRTAIKNHIKNNKITSFTQRTGHESFLNRIHEHRSPGPA